MPTSASDREALAAKLTSLSPEERQDVIRRCKARGALLTPVETFQARDWLLDGICRVAVESGYIAAYVPVLKSPHYPKWQGLFTIIGPALLKATGNPSGGQRAQLARVIGRCYLRWLQNVTGRAPTVRTILINAQSIGTAVEEAFPGYYANGMLDKIIFQRE